MAARAAVDRPGPGHVHAPPPEEDRGRPGAGAAGTQYFAMDVDEVPAVGVQRRTVQQTIDTMVPEQVIEAPKITLHDAIPQRAVLPVPQMAEQLVDEPVHSFDDFQLVEVQGPGVWRLGR